MRWPNFGLLALLVAAGGLFSGVLVAVNYAPTLDAARDSVAYIQEEVALGWLLRGLHHWAGAFAIVLAALHGWRLFWRGAYKAERKKLWVLGCGIFLVLVGFAYTGYLLPGDERAYMGLTVMEDIAGSTPVAGGAIGRVVKGGEVISSATVARIYVVHAVILPALLIVSLVAFVRARRRLGQTAPWTAELARDGVAAVAVLALLGLCAWLAAPDLGPKADPGGPGPAEARPEWFFLWVNELLRRTAGAKFLIGGVLPGLFVGLGVSLPFLARGEARDPARRKPELAVASAILLFVTVLTVLSLSRPAPAQEETAAAGDATADAAAVMKKFKCSKCHVIDGDADGGDTGPPLDRKGFGELYTRKLFRLRVGDPRAFWPDTAMVYTPRRRQPTPAELQTLERWFFGDE